MTWTIRAILRLTALSVASGCGLLAASDEGVGTKRIGADTTMRLDDRPPTQAAQPIIKAADPNPVEAGRGTPPVLAPVRCNAAVGLASFVASNLPADLPPRPEKGLDLGSNVGVRCELDTDSLSWTDDTEAKNEFPSLHVVRTAAGELAVLYVERFRLPATEKLIVVGSRPLVILSASDIEIDGRITAATSKTNSFAAGGATGATTSERRGFGPGGGAAGSATRAGGGGSFCGLGGAAAGSAEPHAPAYGTPLLVPLLGGSSGGSATGESAAGGGALQLVAGRSIVISPSGVLDMGGQSHVAYAGGGSGGAILLEAPEISVLGTVAANGAGGGGGGTKGHRGTTTRSPARPGKLKHPYDWDVEATSGVGSAGASVDGAPGTGKVGAGGGGAGRIRFNSSCPLELGPNVLVTPAKGTRCYSEGKLKARAGA